MTAKKKTSAKKAEPELKLPEWAGKVPLFLLVVGAVLVLAGFFADRSHFAHAWLVSFMFYLSICLGAFFLVLLHYLFDSYWIVSIRRVAEHLACLLPLMAVLFIPIAIWSGMEFVQPEADAVTHHASQEHKADAAAEKAAGVNGDGHAAGHSGETDHSHGGKRAFYQWMQSEREYSDSRNTHDHAWYAKRGYLSKGFWTLRWVFCFAIWGFFTWMLRKHSLEQDRTGAADCTRKCRVLAAVGIFVFAATLTIAAIDWMKGLEYQWFSTMYGVYYFAGSVWTSLITIYIISLFLKKTGPLQDIVRTSTLKDNATLFFAFTVFYAYIHFSQYFLIWNAAIPEETFWYVKREDGPWWNVGMLIIFGHFFVPFLMLLRIDVKTRPEVMITVAVLAWFLHFCDMSYNIMPVIHRFDGWMENIWIDIGCLALMGGALSMVFIHFFKQHPPYPQKDPRIAETMGVYVPLHSEAKAAGKS
ncbi:MAG: hypothetical protein VYC47_02700 [Verrucomicrobiota bacterium]|nr:hypothetical protein [Verrucomicrobiota bacterium]